MEYLRQVLPAKEVGGVRAILLWVGDAPPGGGLSPSLLPVVAELPSWLPRLLPRRTAEAGRSTLRLSLRWWDASKRAWGWLWDGAACGGKIPVAG